MEFNKLYKIPDFIDTSDEEDVDMWRWTRDIIELFYIIGWSDNVLGKRQIKNISNRITANFIKIRENDKCIFVYDYIEKLFDKIIEELIEMEKYEGLENIKKLELIEIKK